MSADIDLAAHVHPPRRPWALRRGPLETTASALIAAGAIMLMQPFSMTLYTWSFVTTLAGTILFTIAARFPE